jgi:hypothetical protein
MARLTRLANVIARAAVAAACAAAAAGCSSTSSPSSPGCTYTVTPTTSISPAGGSAQLTVTTGSSCSWSATSNASWIAVVLTSLNSTGSGTVQIVAGPNNDVPRTGTVTIAGQTVTVTQAVLQLYTLTGRVTETWTEIGVSGVRVTAGGPVFGSTITDRDGFYTLALPPGSYQIQFSRPPLQPATMVVSLSVDTTVNTNLNAAIPFPLPPNEVIGHWSGGGPYPDQPMRMTLIRDGTAVSGWYRDQHSTSDALAGTYSGNTLTFRVRTADGDLTYELNVDDERHMHGFVKNERLGGGNYPLQMIR